MDSTLSRMLTAHKTVGRTHGTWIAPILTGVLMGILRLVVNTFRLLDRVFFPGLHTAKVDRPIVIVGNPRTGTTFLQRFLCDQGIGVGQQLWTMLYPSRTLQALVAPFLPVLEFISPARHHSTAAHKTSLSSVETDDVAVLFRHFDGFFLYGFILAFAEEEMKDHFAPEQRDTNARDFTWWADCWRRSVHRQSGERAVAKVFSLGPRTPAFLEAFPDARILYMARDPLSVLPSAMSLVTGVLDKKFSFWDLPDEVRTRYLERLYVALVELLARFHQDWVSGAIDRERVFVVRFDRLMEDFEGLMDEMLDFVGHEPDEALRTAIRARAEKQRAYKSEHTYDLSKFGLTEERIRTDCAFFYETFLGGTPEVHP